MCADCVASGRAPKLNNKYTKSFTASVCLMLGCCCRWKWVLLRSTGNAHIEEIKQTKGMACNTHIARSTKPKGIFGVIPDGCSGHVVNLEQLNVAKMQERWHRRCAAYTFIIHKFMKLKFQNGCLAVSAHYYRVRHISCGIPGAECRNVTQTTTCHSGGSVLALAHGSNRCGDWGSGWLRGMWH